AYVWWKYWPVIGFSSLRSLRVRLGKSEPAATFGILTVQFVLATVMLVTVGKPGTSINYFIKSMCCGSIFTAIARGLTSAKAQRDALAARWTWRLLPAAALPVALIVQVAQTSPPAVNYFSDPQRIRDLHRLLQEVREAQKPVLSEDLVLLMRADK